MSYGQDNGTSAGTETYKFTGNSYSSANGLYYEFQRWYDNSTGRFISEDPLPGHLRIPQSLNAFAYVLNQPTRLVDPSGLSWKCFGQEDCGGGGASGAGSGSTGSNTITGNDVPSIDVSSNDLSTNTITPEQAPLSYESGASEAPASVGGARPVKLGQMADSAGLSYLANEENFHSADVSYQESLKTDSGNTIRPDLNIRAPGQIEPNRLVELKGGYASGERLQIQADNYSRYAAARGGRVTYVLLGGASQPFLDHLAGFPNIDIIKLY